MEFCVVFGKIAYEHNGQLTTKNFDFGLDGYEIDRPQNVYRNKSFDSAKKTEKNDKKALTNSKNSEKLTKENRLRIFATINRKTSKNMPDKNCIARQSMQKRNHGNNC